MIISELNSGLNLVMKLANFATQLQDGWYKGSAEVNAFREKVWILSAKHAQFNNQLRRFGISEDCHLLRLLKAADEVLEKEHQFVLKLQKSRFLRLKKRVFPVQLSYLIGKVLEIVDAGPQLLGARVTNADFLEKNLVQTAAPLPFGPDSNYVPIVDSIREVRNALENLEGPRVVTLYGGPGMGKSSLVKYVAFSYQERKKQSNKSSPKAASFPDGVHYLFCGQNAQDRVKELQWELLQSLGFGTRYAALPNDGTTAVRVPEPGLVGCNSLPSLDVPSLKLKLRSCLAEQNLLVVIDDLWEEKVLQELLVPAKGVKYLVTSQMRDIWGSAEKLQLERPKQSEGRQIMANYTDGLPIKGEFPENLKSVTDAIIGAVEYHPLSLANVGMSINRSWATDERQWKLIKDNLNIHLDENDFRNPLGFDTPYNLAVSASMMLMVESLPSPSQRILYLLALFEGAALPQHLVKIFFKFIQPADFALKFTNQQKFLEDRSLIELRIQGKRPVLGTHGLRSHYIRKKKTVEMMSIASQILTATSDQEAAKIIKRGDAEETLLAVLSAMHFDQSFKDIVASSLENHVRILNDGVIPRNMSTMEDALDLVKSAKRQQYEVHYLVDLLNADHGEGDWRHQAHEHAKKVIIRFVCQGKLDDNSMARLLELPQTTAAACGALKAIIYRSHHLDFHDQNITFSVVHQETVQTLLTLFHKDTTATERRSNVMSTLQRVRDYESKETMFSLAPNYKKSPAMNTNSVTNVLEKASGRGVLTRDDFSGLFEDLVALLLLGKDHEVRLNAGLSILNWSGNRPKAVRIAAELPNALQMLFNFFLSEDTIFADETLQAIAGDTLCQLSLIPENRIKFRVIEGICEGFGDILAKVERAWRATSEEQDHRKLKKRACIAAGVLGYLGLEKSFKKSIASLPGVGEGLLFLQRIEMATGYTETLRRHFDVYWFYGSTRTLTVLRLNAVDGPNPTDLLGDMFDVFPSKEPPTSTAISSSVADVCHVSLYWTRVLAYIQMGFYAEALANLDRVHFHLNLIPKPANLTDYSPPSCEIYSLGHRKSHMGSRYSFNALRDCRIFLQAMLEDYDGALVGASTRLDDDAKVPWAELAVVGLAERGVLKRFSGDLLGALDDLNAAARKATMTDYYPTRTDDVLWHRGYVKYLLHDETGAREDAELAQQLKVEYRNTDNTLYHQGAYLWMLAKLSVTYLGFSSLINFLDMT